MSCQRLQSFRLATPMFNPSPISTSVRIALSRHSATVRLSGPLIFLMFRQTLRNVSILLRDGLQNLKRVRVIVRSYRRLSPNSFTVSWCLLRGDHLSHVYAHTIAPRQPDRFAEEHFTRCLPSARHILHRPLICGSDIPGGKSLPVGNLPLKCF